LFPIVILQGSDFLSQLSISKEVLAMDHLNLKLLLQRKIEQGDRLLGEVSLHFVWNAGVLQVEEADIDNGIFQRGQKSRSGS
jgi:hypothetical protein